MTTNLAYKVIAGRWIFTAYGPDDATEEDAAEILRVLRSMDLKHVKMVTYTTGGTLSLRHRKEVNAVIGKNNPPLAVLVENPFARGVITALSWFNPAVKAFSLGDEFDAFDYVGIPEDMHDHCSEVLHGLIGEMEARRERKFKKTKS